LPFSEKAHVSYSLPEYPFFKNSLCSTCCVNNWLPVNSFPGGLRNTV